jgi:membrane protein implicated in regulation of membrane protease activity
MKANFELTKEDLLTYNLSHQARSPALRRQRAWTVGVCLGAAVILGGVMCLPSAGDFGRVANFWPVAYFFLAIGILKPLLWRRQVRRIVDRMLNEGRNRSLLGKREVLITPADISTAGELRSTIVRWKAVERIVEEREVLYVYISSVDAVIIPRRAFASDDEFAAFGAACRKYWTEAAQ